MRLKTFVVSMMETNSYIVIDENTFDAVVIDPGGEGNEIIDFIKRGNIKLNAILLTHAHFDHIGACEQVRDEFKVPVIICEGEEIIIENSVYNLSAMLHRKIAFKADKIFHDGEEMQIGSMKLKVIKTPGHTPGSCCFYFNDEKVLFSGDTLFRDSVGRTDFPLSDTKALIASLREKIFCLDNSVTVYCGHGPMTTLAYEKQYNPYA